MRALTVWEAQFTSLKLTTVTAQTVKSHSTTAANVYRVFRLTDGTWLRDRAFMDHRLYGIQRELQAEIKRDDFSFISIYFDLKENKCFDEFNHWCCGRYFSWCDSVYSDFFIWSSSWQRAGCLGMTWRSRLCRIGVARFAASRFFLEHSFRFRLELYLRTLLNPWFRKGLRVGHLLRCCFEDFQSILYLSFKLLRLIVRWNLPE